MENTFSFQPNPDLKLKLHARAALTAKTRPLPSIMATAR